MFKGTFSDIEAHTMSIISGRSGGEDTVLTDEQDPFTALNGFHQEVSLQAEESTRRLSLVQREMQFGTLGELISDMPLDRRRYSLPVGNGLINNSVFRVPRMGKNQVLPILKPIARDAEKGNRETHTI